jgi:hypothetical protein
LSFRSHAAAAVVGYRPTTYILFPASRRTIFLSSISCGASHRAPTRAGARRCFARSPSTELGYLPFEPERSPQMVESPRPIGLGGSDF